MSIIDEIQEYLEKHNIKYEYIKDQKYIHTISDKNGFDVGITVNMENEDLYTLNFSSWHEEYSNKQDVLYYFKLGLSNRCRLIVSKKGNLAYKYVAEFLNEDDHWERMSLVCLFFFPFWKKTTKIFLQNKYF